MKLLANVMIVAGMFFSAQYANAEAKSLQEVQVEKAGNDLKIQIEQLKKQAEAISNVTKYKCMRSFGHEGFCSCLSNKIPMVATFGEYVAATSYTKEELGYEGLDKGQQRFVDLLIQAREECVIAHVK